MELTAQKGKGDRENRASDCARTRDIRSIAEFQPCEPRRPVEILCPPSPLCTGNGGRRISTGLPGWNSAIEHRSRVRARLLVLFSLSPFPFWAVSSMNMVITSIPAHKYSLFLRYNKMAEKGKPQIKTHTLMDALSKIGILWGSIKVWIPESGHRWLAIISSLSHDIPSTTTWMPCLSPSPKH